MQSSYIVYIYTYIRIERRAEREGGGGGLIAQAHDRPRACATRCIIDCQIMVAITINTNRRGFASLSKKKKRKENKKQTNKKETGHRSQLTVQGGPLVSCTTASFGLSPPQARVQMSTTKC